MNDDTQQVEGLDLVQGHDPDGDVSTITEWAKKQRLSIKRWAIDEDGDIFAGLGRATVQADDERRGLFKGDVGELQVSMVGSETYGNRRIHLGLLNEDVESVYEVPSLDLVELEG